MLRIFIIACCCCLLAVAALGQDLFSEQAVIGKDAASELYNVELTVQPSAGAGNAQGVQVATEWDNAQTYTLVTITRTRISFSAVSAGKRLATQGVDVELKPETAVHLTLMRRAGWLGVLRDDAFIYGSDFARAPGNNVSVSAGPGWSVPVQTLQPLEPVNYADDFMRTENKFWAPQHGDWFLQSAWQNDPKSRSMNINDAPAAQNPFAYIGRSPAGGAAWCSATSSKPFWDDYVMTVAVQPALDGAVGVLVNMTGPASGLLVRWTPAGDRASHGGEVQLCRMLEGKISVLAQAPGGFIPGQWFKLTVSSSVRDGVQVAIDNQVRVPFVRTAVRRGGIGLYTESAAGAVFDNITVYGSRLNIDLLEARRALQINERFQEDKEMSSWAKTQNEWQSWPGTTDLLLNRNEYEGDQSISAAVSPFRVKSGEFMLALNSDGQEMTSGYRLLIARTDDLSKFSYTLYRNDVVLAPTTEGEACKAGEEYTFRFSHTGNTLQLQCDGKPALTATDAQPLPGRHTAYRASGCFSLAHDLQVISRNVLDYTFTSAPVDWLGEGKWLPTIRWSCAPQWSFLGGWSRGDAVLWHKQRFDGDQTFQAFLGIKMEYPRARNIYEDRYRALGISICTDGKNPRSGYAVLFGAPDEQGNPNRRTLLLRNGEIVASSSDGLPSKTYGHHTWFDMQLRKRGNLVTFQVNYVSKNMWHDWEEGRPMTVKLSYTDPTPLAGGIPAIWAPDNGITVARARLIFSTPPQPRTLPLVGICDASYPEWANVGQALTLNFPPLWSTEGKAALLHVEAAAVPKGEEQSAVVQGAAVVFTPRQIGDYWYKLDAVVGENRSPFTHLSLPVFNPALGRDDSHALVLYRFDEGAGKLVHDRSTVAPAANLVVPKEAQWLSGQGLAFTGPTPLMTTQGVAKLAALKKSNAGSIEFWLSAATTDPPTHSQGCLLSWGELQNGTRNFTCMHVWYNPQLLGPGAFYNVADERWQGPHLGGTEYRFYPYLEHLVFTCDGNVGHVYVDGKEVKSDVNMTGFSDNWSENAPLFLGNIGDMSLNYIGTYYLVAIHDRCLPAAEVLHNYQAGPSAR